MFFLNHYSVKYILLFYLYLIFNSFISLNYELGLARNFGFLRLVFYIHLLNYFFFFIKILFKNYINYWTISFIFFLIYFIKQFTGSNILGWGAIEIKFNHMETGILSFFKDEPINRIFY